MNLRGVREGDIVRLRDDASLWLVVSRQGQALRLRIPRGASATRRVSSRQVVEAWRRVGHRRGSA
jgi:hypothetical protein